jgi:hypothetical protein
MRFTLRIWRQQNATARGALVNYEVTDVSPDMSFLEMLDVLNEHLTRAVMSPSRSIMIAGRHLRRLLADDQRSSARAQEGNCKLPAAHAKLP